MRNIVEPWMNYFFKNSAGLCFACEIEPIRSEATGVFWIEQGQYGELHTTKPFGNIVEMYWPKHECETTLAFTKNNELITRNSLELLIGD